MPTPAALAIPAARTPAELRRSWQNMDPGERKREAARAARDRDTEALAGLALAEREAFTGRLSPHTARAYRAGVAALVAYCRETGASLLRPAPDWGLGYVRELEASGKAPATVRSRLAAARALYAGLRWAGATEARPFERVRVRPDPTAPRDKRRAYSAEEVAALLDHAGSARLRAAILLGAHAGLRCAEILGLRWQDVDLDGRRLRVHGKGDKVREVPGLTPALRAALEELHALAGNPAPEDRVVPGISASGLRDALRRAARRAGVDARGRGLHALRHHAGEELYRLTGDPFAVQQFLGHADSRTTERYAGRAHRLRERLLEWA